MALFERVTRQGGRFGAKMGQKAPVVSVPAVSGQLSARRPQRLAFEQFLGSERLALVPINFVNGADVGVI